MENRLKAWIEFQHKLYAQVLEDLKQRLAKKPAKLRQYEKEFRSDLTKLKKSTYQRMLRSMNQSDFVFIGDFHSLRQSQRFLIRLLRESTVKLPQALAFEVIAPKDAIQIEHYLNRPTRKKEKELKEQLELEQVWATSWSIYKELFFEAHKKGIKIIGLKTSSRSIDQRDQEGAKCLSKQNKTTWILFGEHHCARPHLPRKLQKLASDRKITVIQQNDDQLTMSYLTKMIRSKNLVFQAPKWREMELFCVLHTPLWVKWQSYLDHALSDEEAPGELDPEQQIRWSLQTLKSFLKDPRYPSTTSDNELIDFSVYSVEDDDFLATLRTQENSKQKQILEDLESCRVSILPEKRLVFLSEVTLNSCAHAAGTYLYLRWSGQEELKQGFFRYLFQEAISFFLSKLLNHSRKSLQWQDWKKLSERGHRKQEARKILHAASFSDPFIDQKRLLREIRPYERQVTVAWGRMLGEWAFEAFLAGEFSRERLLRIITEPIMNETQAFELVVELKSVGQFFKPLEP